MSRHKMTESHFTRIKQASNYIELRLVAEEIIALLPDPLGMVCGPISTGGLGNIEANEVRFIEVIVNLQKAGLHIFDQMVFEPRMKDFVTLDHTGYDHRILHDFYKPIFASGRIRYKFFIPGWETSTGACWEREQAPVHNIQVVDLDYNFLPIW